MSKLELIKQLEYLSAFQAECLLRKDWESFDKAEIKISDLETRLLKSGDDNFHFEINEKRDRMEKT